MSTFRVRASSLGEVSAQLQGVIAIFDAHVATMATKVSSISGSSWVGEDQQAFQQQWETWRESSELVRMSLSTLSAQLLQAEGGYTMTESGVTGNVNQTRQGQVQTAGNAQDIGESVETGLERARSTDESETGSAQVAYMNVRTGQGAQQAGPAADDRSPFIGAVSARSGQGARPGDSAGGKRQGGEST